MAAKRSNVNASRSGPDSALRPAHRAWRISWSIIMPSIAKICTSCCVNRYVEGQRVAGGRARRLKQTAQCRRSNAQPPGPLCRPRFNTSRRGRGFGWWRRRQPLQYQAVVPGHSIEGNFQGIVALGCIMIDAQPATPNAGSSSYQPTGYRAAGKGSRGFDAFATHLRDSSPVPREPQPMRTSSG